MWVRIWNLAEVPRPEVDLWDDAGKCMLSLLLALRPLCYTRVEYIAEWLSKQIWPSSLPPIWCVTLPAITLSCTAPTKIRIDFPSLAGPALSPVVSGYISHVPQLDWRTIFHVDNSSQRPPPLPPNSPILTCVHGGLTLVLLVLFPEAFAPAILLKEAQRLRSRGGETGANAIAPLELKDRPLRTALSSTAGSATARSDPICVCLAATVVGRASLANGVPAD